MKNKKPHWFLKSVVTLFEERVAQNPKQLAVKFAEQSLSYDMLNAKANQLAHYLISYGIKPKDNVAIALPSSIERIIVMLAVLKTGATYLALDLEYPALRTQQMLMDSQAKLLITNSTTHCIVEEFPIAILYYDQTVNLFNSFPTQNIMLDINSQDLLCIIYTSGTTGKPKGVCVTHLGVSRLVLNTNYIKINEHDVFSQLSNFAFDAILFEIWGALLNGASLVIFPKDVFLDVEQFEKTIKNNSITIMFNTTQLFNALCLEKPMIFSSLKYLLIAGEVANPRTVTKLLHHKHKPENILNLYGPTENTTFSTYYLIEEVQQHTSIPIGKAIAHTKYYILDRHLQPVAQGEIGELYLSGWGLAKGYFNNDKLTKAKFITNPFNQQTKLYKTGDRVRLLTDGNLEFIGRIDNQVKIRGFRIELNEITHFLLQHPAIFQAVLVLKEPEQSEKYLVAYIVLAENVPSVNVETLQLFLGKSLPSVMVPNIFVVLNQLPMTPNGKINKKALPEPDDTNTLKATKASEKPTTLTEKNLAAIWSRALHINDISIHDNFFNLGGHSLLLTQILLNIKKRFGVSVSLKQFYDNNTIYQQGKLIDHKTFDKQMSVEETDLNLMKFDSVLANHLLSIKKLLPQSSKLENILLTGCSGFVGIHLLFELLKQTKANICCFVRGRNKEDILKKITKALEKYHLDLSLNERKRIVPVKSDLNLPQLGLDDDEWQHFSTIIDVIYHNAAHVHHLYPYYKIRNANVLGTVELIKLAREYKIKPIHYISTVGAAVKIDQHGLLAEDFPDDEMIKSDIGYYQTKWVSERLLTQLKDLPSPVSIYRLGHVSGQSETGICSFNSDHFQLFVKGCIQMCSAPKLDLKVDMAPVDMVAKMVISLSLDEKTMNNVFNIFNHHLMAWNAYVNWLNDHGFYLQQLNYPVWLEKLKMQNANNALYPLMPFYLENNYTLFSLESADRPLPNSAKTIAACKAYHLQFRVIDYFLLKTYVDYLLCQKFLPSNRKAA